MNLVRNLNNLNAILSPSHIKKQFCLPSTALNETKIKMKKTRLFIVTFTLSSLTARLSVNLGQIQPSVGCGDKTRT